MLIEYDETMRIPPKNKVGLTHLCHRGPDKTYHLTMARHKDKEEPNLMKIRYGPFTYPSTFVEIVRFLWRNSKRLASVI